MNNLQALPFFTDVIDGLSQTPKSLPCKWFYDEAGSKLFEKITQTPEYYLTRAETSLLISITPKLKQHLANCAVIIEPGSGASTKTRLLLDAFPDLSDYIPMDISANFLETIAKQLQADYPSMHITPAVGDFTAIDAPLTLPLAKERLVFFPGSTIGNFSPSQAKALLNSFHHLAGPDGYLLIGVDGTQASHQLMAAYDDQEGITAAFNKNLLVHANQELSADFDLTQFAHHIKWDPDNHRIEMHLKSLTKQTVTIADHSFTFSPNETICTEHCYKYTRAIFEPLAADCGWEVMDFWIDNPQQSEFQLILLKPTR